MDVKCDINLYIALIHHPVRNKNGEIIASAITNLDLHDIARSAKTFGVKGFYVTTPLADQQMLARKIIDHWVSGYGARYNPKRKSALELIAIKDVLNDVTKDIYRIHGTNPRLVATSAWKNEKSISFQQLKDLLRKGDPVLVMFGTAWGLSKDISHKTDFFLEPIRGVTDYNHLSVRSASAIILDRLMGNMTAN